MDKTIEEQLSEELAASVQNANERANPAVSIALWPNTRRVEGKNHAQFSGRVTLNLQAIAALAATAMAEGKTDIELWANVWHNPVGSVSPQTGKARPTLSGNASRVVGEAATTEAATG